MLSEIHLKNHQPHLAHSSPLDCRCELNANMKVEMCREARRAEMGTGLTVLYIFEELLAIT